MQKKMSKSLLKLKIEKIAKNLLNKNLIQTNDIDTNKEMITNQLSSDESTIKDSLSEFEEITKNVNNINNQNFKIKNNYFSSKNSNNLNTNNNRHHSSLCTKMTSLTENNSGPGTLDYNSNFDTNKVNINIKNKNINEQRKIPSNELIIKNIIDNNVNNINIEILNNLTNIYKNLIELFNFNMNQYYKNNNKDEDTNNKLKKEMNHIDTQIKILSYKYINFIFSDDMEMLAKLFYSNIEINKYFISQIYLFISFIYLYEESIISNSYLLISCKSIAFYSLLNMENILNIINLPLLLQNEKLLNNLKSINKIIFSILKIINPKVPSNSQIIDFISQNKSKQNITDNTNNHESKYSGLLKLIFLLKENDNLNEKLFKIEMLKLSFIEENVEKDNYSINNNTNNVLKSNLNINNNINNSSDSYDIINQNNNKNIILTKKNKSLLLPPMDTKKYKLSIAIELDETLVHYCEDGDNYYAKVRFGSENFLKNISAYFEIIVVSTSGKEYSNIIIDNINKDDKCYVEQRIYIEDFVDGQNLSNINRDIKKLIFVCHDYNFFDAPKENIILLKEFKGEEEDREIIKLYNELKLLIDNNNITGDEFDIRNLIPKIMQRISLNIDYIDYLEEEEEDENDNEKKEENIKN